MIFIMAKPNAISKLEPVSMHLRMTPLTGKKPKRNCEIKKFVKFNHIFHTGGNASFDFETFAKEFDEFRLLLRQNLLE